MDLMEKIEKANAETVKRMTEAQPFLVDVLPALEVVPGMTPTTILHSGPPIRWENMCGPQKNGVIGAMLFEGLAKNVEQAEKMIEGKEITLSPCHEHSTVGSMAGITSPSMNVFVVKNKIHNNLSYHQIYGPGKNMLTFGLYDEQVLEDYRWTHTVLAEALRAGIRQSGGIGLNNIISRALTMGDECHNRSVAGTYRFALEIIPHMVEAGVDKSLVAKFAANAAEFFNFFLFLNMAACKNIADAAHGIEYSTIVTTLCRNGYEFGVKVSGLGDRWFTGPAPEIEGLYFNSKTTKADACPDMGDSAITETVGLGGFVMVNAPTFLQMVGGTIDDALQYTREMGEITVSRNPNFSLPFLDFEGSPLGIDIRKIVDLNITPIIDTGIASKKGGFIGIGLNRAPMKPFKEALLAFAEKYSN